MLTHVVPPSGPRTRWIAGGWPITKNPPRVAPGGLLKHEAT